jgi:hypothetical protein
MGKIMSLRSIFFIAAIGLSMGSLAAQDLTGVKIHINPGHGGWDGDDRGIPTPLYPSVGPNVGFWESQSNLDKGLQLRTMLEALGCEVQMSRTQNRTADDLPLSTIVRMANEFGADFMLSIHSNAGAGTSNYVLMLYAGKDVGDTHNYPTATPVSDESRAISTAIAQNLFSNTLTHWTGAFRVTGDKTFGRTAMGWSDGYGVLRGLRVPGVISEGAMHDYIPETYRLLNMEYKWLEAWNFKKAFCAYFEGGEIPTGNIAGWVKDSRNLLLDGTYKKYAGDVFLPLDGATVTIEGTGRTYTVDQQRNGVYVFKDLAPGTYRIRAEAAGYYPQTQEVAVVRNEIAGLNFSLNKVRSTPPEVVDYSPKVEEGESVECSTDIVLDFNWDMDEASVRDAFSISPAVAGKITFEDSQFRMRFTPDMPLEASTLYTVRLAKSAKHPDEKTMTADFVLQFMTKDRNRLALLQGYPSPGDEGVFFRNPVFWLVFDRRLNTANLRDEIKVMDASGREMAKATRSVKNNNVPAPYGAFYFQLTDALEPDKDYRVVIGAEVKDEVGVKVADPIAIDFRTATVAVSGKPVAEDFETPGKYVYDAERSNGVTGVSVARSTATCLFGQSSYQLKGAFAADDGAFVTYNVVTPEVAAPRSYRVGLHIYGDLSGNAVELLFSNGTEVAVGLCTLDFAGWEYVETGLSALPEGEDFTLAGIRVVRKESLLNGAWDICVDNLLIYPTETGLVLPEAADGEAEIYPNPASEMVFVRTASGETPRLRLYSLGGALRKEVWGNALSVKGVGQGTYILEVRTEAGTFGRRVVVTR